MESIALSFKMPRMGRFYQILAAPFAQKYTISRDCRAEKQKKSRRTSSEIRRC